MEEANITLTLHWIVGRRTNNSFLTFSKLSNGADDCSLREKNLDFEIKAEAEIFNEYFLSRIHFLSRSVV